VKIFIFEGRRRDEEDKRGLRLSLIFFNREE